MHTQHVKFSTYVGGGGVGVVFEEGEMSGLVEDDDRSGLEVVVVVVLFLPSPSLLLVSFSVVLLDCIGTTEGLFLFCADGTLLIVQFDRRVLSSGCFRGHVSII